MWINDENENLTKEKKDKEINNKPVYYKARKTIFEIVSMRMYVWERLGEREMEGEWERDEGGVRWWVGRETDIEGASVPG